MRVLEHLWLGRVPYRDAWALQRRLAGSRARGDIDDLLLLMEHPPVFTMGRQGDAEHLLGGPEHLIARGAEYVEVDRGGSVTFHGPGQLVAYPILRLAEVFPLPEQPGLGDAIAHLRALEVAMIATVARHGVRARRHPPFTGVWVGGQKLGAIGVKLAGGVTIHGAALNVNTDLSWFAEVIPCGIAGAGVASLASLGVDPVPPLPEIGEELASDFATVIGASLRPASSHVRDGLAAPIAAAWPLSEAGRRGDPEACRGELNKLGDLPSQIEPTAASPAQEHKPLVKPH
ncbi:MAG: lipoyl(octanoyl) transferase LipB [Candidatus Dormibacteria bacterium]